MLVAFQGEHGAYSESAVYSYFGRSVEVLPCKTFREVFDKVERKEVDYGVVPVENSLVGSVVETYDLFLEYDLKVRGEVIIKVSHCLITNVETDIDSVEVVYSHPQALAQCRRFLESFGRTLIPTYDTAGSVKMMKEKRLLNAAAIASEKAAEIYGMKIVARDIADNPNNYTRFFVLGEEDHPPTGNDKTSIIFSVPHKPGSLYNALAEFAKRNINLTKIESRPTRKKLWEFNFYLDFEGHRKERKFTEAIEALKSKAYFVKILGSYPKASNKI